MTHLARKTDGMQYVFTLTEISHGKDSTFQACKPSPAFISSNPSSSLLSLRSCIRSSTAQHQPGTERIKMRSHQSTCLELHSSSLSQRLIPLFSQKSKQRSTAWRWLFHDRHTNRSSKRLKFCNNKWLGHWWTYLPCIYRYTHTHTYI